MWMRPTLLEEGVTPSFSPRLLIFEPRIKKSSLVFRHDFSLYFLITIEHFGKSSHLDVCNTSAFALHTHMTFFALFSTPPLNKAHARAPPLRAISSTPFFQPPLGKSHNDHRHLASALLLSAGLFTPRLQVLINQ